MVDAWCGCVEEDIRFEWFRLEEFGGGGVERGSTGFGGFEDGAVFTPGSEVGEWTVGISAETPE
jgi:hypothetical protein